MRQNKALIIEFVIGIILIGVGAGIRTYCGFCPSDVPYMVLEQARPS